jgi:transcriptional regulator with XRE-family HTH domain
MTFGEKVKTARLKKFLSQEAMAKELSVSFSTLNRWENDKAEPNYAAQKAFHDFCVKHGIKFEEEK